MCLIPDFTVDIYLIGDPLVSLCFLRNTQEKYLNPGFELKNNYKCVSSKLFNRSQFDSLDVGTADEYDCETHFNSIGKERIHTSRGKMECISSQIRINWLQHIFTCPYSQISITKDFLTRDSLTRDSLTRDSLTRDSLTSFEALKANNR